MSQAPHFNVREAKTERSGDLAGGVVKGCELGLESGFPALGPVLLYPQLVPLVTQSMDGELADGAGNPHPWELVGVQFSSVTQSSLSLCNPMDCSRPGLPVHHQLLELAQTHVHLLSSPSPAFSLAQH